MYVIQPKIINRPVPAVVAAVNVGKMALFMTYLEVEEVYIEEGLKVGSCCCCCIQRYCFFFFFFLGVGFWVESIPTYGYRKS